MIFWIWCNPVTESRYGLEYCISGFDILVTFGALWLMFLIPETLDISKQVANRKYYHKETMIAREYDRKTYTTTTSDTMLATGGNGSGAGGKIILYLKRLGEPL